MTDTAEPTRDENIQSVQRLLWQLVRQYDPPAGMTHEDLVSEVNLTLCRRYGEFDPEKGAFTTWAGWIVRGVCSAARQAARAQKRGGGEAAVSLEGDDADGERFTLPADRRACDPSEIAEARELVAVPPPRRRGQLSVRQLEATLPSPVEVADQVTRLRSAMFSAIKAEDVEAVMGSIVAAAKGGDLKAAKLLIDLLAPSRSGVSTVVNQQAVVIHPGDLS